MSALAARTLAMSAVKSFSSAPNISVPSTLRPCSSAFLLHVAVMPFITGLSWVMKMMVCGLGLTLPSMSK